jgi:hypothetical protein
MLSQTRPPHTRPPRFRFVQSASLSAVPSFPLVLHRANVWQSTSLCQVKAQPCVFMRAVCDASVSVCVKDEGKKLGKKRVAISLCSSVCAHVTLTFAVHAAALPCSRACFLTIAFPRIAEPARAYACACTRSFFLVWKQKSTKGCVCCVHLCVVSICVRPSARLQLVLVPPRPIALASLSAHSSCACTRVHGVFS